MSDEVIVYRFKLVDGIGVGLLVLVVSRAPIADIESSLIVPEVCKKIFNGGVAAGVLRQIFVCRVCRAGPAHNHDNNTENDSEGNYDFDDRETPAAVSCVHDTSGRKKSCSRRMSPTRPIHDSRDTIRQWL